MEIRVKDKLYKIPWEYMIAPFLIFLTGAILIISHVSEIKTSYIDFSDKVTTAEADPSSALSSDPAEYQKNSMPSAVSEEIPKPGPQAASEPDKVNINKADMDELMVLPYIGEVKAKAIISYRNEHGHFTSVDELENIKGIGTKTLEKLRPLVTLK